MKRNSIYRTPNTAAGLQGLMSRISDMNSLCQIPAARRKIDDLLSALERLKALMANQESIKDFEEMERRHP